nr:type VI secretion system baseplate subunit TssE [Larsenimonas suaedae]
MFERINTAPAGGSVTTESSQFYKTVESIKHHLVRLLNSHPGNCESRPTLGLMDFNDATVGTLDLELTIQRAIKSCIERFEPRVDNVDVRVMPRDEPLSLRFQIRANVRVPDDMGRATIDLVLNDKRYRCLE